MHRLLMSMLSEGFVDRDHGSGRWQLGPELFFLGGAARSKYDVSEITRPVVRRLAASTGDTAFFSARRGTETICLVHEEGSFPVRSHVVRAGTRLPLGVASAGLAILAHLPDAEVAAYLVGENLPGRYSDDYSDSALLERVKTTRLDGYAVNPGLVVQGDWGMGAAVFNRDGHPRWALSLTGIEQRFAEPRRDELGQTLLRAAHELTRVLRGN